MVCTLLYCAYLLETHIGQASVRINVKHNRQHLLQASDIFNRISYFLVSIRYYLYNPMNHVTTNSFQLYKKTPFPYHLSSRWRKYHTFRKKDMKNLLFCLEQMYYRWRQKFYNSIFKGVGVLSSI